MHVAQGPTEEERWSRIKDYEWSCVLGLNEKKKTLLLGRYETHLEGRGPVRAEGGRRPLRRAGRLCLREAQAELTLEMKTPVQVQNLCSEVSGESSL